MKLSTVAISAVFALNAMPASAETFLCIADNATGYAYDPTSKEWKSAKFNFEGSRHIIKRSSGSQYAWEVNEYGVTEKWFPDAGCKEDFNTVGLLYCEGVGRDFRFNKSNGRYIFYFAGSYINFDPRSEREGYQKDGGDTPFIELGTCTKI